MLFQLLFQRLANTHAFLREYAPTNRLVARLRTRRGLKWGVPAMLIGVAYMYAAAICTGILDRGGPGWLNLLALAFFWNGLKFLLIGPINLIDLVHARWIEWRQRRGKAPRARRSRRHYEPSCEPRLLWNFEQKCSGLTDHTPTHDCFTNGRCPAAMAVIQSSKDNGWLGP